jgi:glutathione synthase/RimK-type ligase-like ATP-grasp enzyme
MLNNNVSNKMKLQLLSTNSTKGSQSLKQLALALTHTVGYKVLRTTKINTKRKQLKYGNSVNKLQQYQWFKEQGLSALEFTTDSNEAMGWAVDGSTVFGRKLLSSSCGKGIVVFDKETAAAIHGCPVYTKYKKKKREFRVHVFKGVVVSVTEKKRKSGWTGQQDTKIRNLANGYVFCQEVTNEPEGLRELALKAATVVQSDFKGVDVGYNEKNNDLFIIEVNSAPGITGSNINKYVQGILSNV